MSETEKKCSTCKYWRNPEPYFPKDGKHACLRFPPAVIYKKDGDRGLAVFPSTMENDWCGEWANENS